MNRLSKGFASGIGGLTPGVRSARRGSKSAEKKSRRPLFWGGVCDALEASDDGVSEEGMDADGRREGRDA